MMDSVREQWLLLISTPLYVAVILFEMALSHYKHRGTYTVKDTITNLYLMLLNSGIDLLFRAVYVVVFQVLYTHRVFEFQSQFWYWFWLIVGMDFLYYWLHRIDHFCRFFWAVHVTHHSSEKFNLTTGFRSSVFQPLYRFIYFIPLPAAGHRFYLLRNANLGHSGAHRVREQNGLAGIHPCHPLASPRTPRLQPAVPRPQHGHVPHYLGHDVWHVSKRIATGRIPASSIWFVKTHRQAQRFQHCFPRMEQHFA
jgi:Fatty acid hydroxylase superfamily